LQVFFFCGGLVGGWLRTPCMAHHSQNAKVHCSCYCPDLVPRGDGQLEAKLDERVGGVSLGDLLQGFNGFSVSYRNLPPKFLCESWCAGTSFIIFILGEIW
jgi:hypothetical protein